MRRRIATLTLFVLLGVVLSFGSGWCCLLWRVWVAVPVVGADEYDAGHGVWPLSASRHWPPASRVLVTRGWGYERIIAYGSDVRATAGIATRTVSVSELMAMGPVLPVPFSIEPKSYTMFRRRTGWPFHCLQSSWQEAAATRGSRVVLTEPSDGTPEMRPDTMGRGWTWWRYVERGVPCPQSRGFLGSTTIPFTLPLRPLGWGFAANTAVWALAAWGTFGGLRVVRRALRERRGLCPGCGYPVGVAGVCTECGRPLRHRRAEAA